MKSIGLIMAIAFLFMGRFSSAEADILGEIQKQVEANTPTVFGRNVRPSAPLRLGLLKFEDDPDTFLNFFLIAKKSLSPADLRSLGFSRPIESHSKYFAILVSPPTLAKDRENVGPDTLVRVLRVDGSTDKVFWLANDNEFEVIEIQESMLALGAYSAVAWGVGGSYFNSSDVMQAWVRSARERLPSYLNSSPFSGKVRHGTSAVDRIAAPSPDVCDGALESPPRRVWSILRFLPDLRRR